MYRDYKCKKCGHVQLVQKKYKEDWKDSVKCEKCKGKSEKQFSNFVFQVAGGHNGAYYDNASLTPTSLIPGMRGVIPGVEVDSE